MDSNTAGPISGTSFYGAIADVPTRDPVTKEDIQDHFKTHGAGNITEVKLMNGFGFIEYDDAMDARDVVPCEFQIACFTDHVTNTIQLSVG